MPHHTSHTTTTSRRRGGISTQQEQILSIPTTLSSIRKLHSLANHSHNRSSRSQRGVDRRKVALLMTTTTVENGGDVGATPTTTTTTMSSSITLKTADPHHVWSSTSSQQTTLLPSLRTIQQSSYYSSLLGLRPLSPPHKKVGNSKSAVETDAAAATTNHHVDDDSSNDATTTSSTTSHSSKPPMIQQLFHQKNKRHHHKKKGNVVKEYFPFLSDGGKSSSSKRQKSGTRLSRGENKQPTVDPFTQLPDEMVLRIFTPLTTSKLTLTRLTQVCTRFHKIAQEPLLWERMDCAGSTLTTTQLTVLVNRKPVYLRLARAVINEDDTDFSPVSPLPIKYLDLTMAIVSPSVIAKLLAVCPKLEKLSLEHCVLSREVIIAMRKFEANLEVLNLAMCYDVPGGDLEYGGGIAEVLRGCGRLTELNMSCISFTTGSQDVTNPTADATTTDSKFTPGSVPPWTPRDLTSIVASLPVSLTRLNLSGFRYILKDEHIFTLSSKLHDSPLTDLDISDSQELTGTSLDHISTNLTCLQHLSLSRCYGIEPAAYAILCNMKTLQGLELFSLFKEASLKNLQRGLNAGLGYEIKVNQFPLSSIARPTVGAKRSSIWGVRVRE